MCWRTDCSKTTTVDAAARLSWETSSAVRPVIHLPVLHVSTRCLWSTPTPVTPKRLRGCWRAAPLMGSLSWPPSTLSAPIKEVTCTRLCSEDPQLTLHLLHCLHATTLLHRASYYSRHRIMSGCPAGWVQMIQLLVSVVQTSACYHVVSYSRFCVSRRVWIELCCEERQQLYICRLQSVHGSYQCTSIQCFIRWPWIHLM